MRARISHWPSPIYVPSRKSWRDPEDEKHSPVTMQRDEGISGNITVRRLTSHQSQGGLPAFPNCSLLISSFDADIPHNRCQSNSPFPAICWASRGPLLQSTVTVSTRYLLCSSPSCPSPPPPTLRNIANRDINAINNDPASSGHASTAVLCQPAPVSHRQLPYKPTINWTLQHHPNNKIHTTVVQSHAPCQTKNKCCTPPHQFHPHHIRRIGLTPDGNPRATGRLALTSLSLFIGTGSTGDTCGAVQTSLSSFAISVACARRGCTESANLIVCFRGRALASRNSLSL